MTGPAGAAARGFRAGALSLVAVVIAGAAHGEAHGCVDLLGLVLALGTCWPAAVAVLGRTRSGPVLVAWLAGAQVVTHVLVEATCGGQLTVVPGSRMLLVHVAAVLVSGLLLARADDGLWVARALRRAVARLRFARPTPVPPVRRPPHPRAAALLLPRLVWKAAPAARRGPPVSAALA